MAKLMVVVGGATAVGKTAAAIHLAQYFACPVISADSRQLYRELKIGVASPNESELAAARHYMIGMAGIADAYHASRYEQEVLPIIESLFQEHDVLILCGGAGLYIDAILHGIDNLPDIPTEVRAFWAGEFKQHGIAFLQNTLQQRDPEYYRVVDINNPMRLLKAIEVHDTTGKPYSYWITGKPKERPFKRLILGLTRPRDVLYDRINARVLTMINAGLVTEVSELLAFRHLKPLDTVGYKEIFDYLDEKYSLNEAIDLIQRNTRKYARKQISWLKRYPDTKWVDADDYSEMVLQVQHTMNGKW